MGSWVVFVKKTPYFFYPKRENIMARNKTGPLLKYLDQQLSSEALAAERRKQLKRISTIRKRPILVMAADLNNNSSVFYAVVSKQ